MTPTPNKVYSPDQVRRVRILYAVAVFGWVCICAWLRMFTTGFVGFIIVVIPIVLFTMAIVNAPEFCTDMERHMFKTNFLSLGLIVTIPLFKIMTKNYKGDKTQYLYVILLAIVFTMFSLVDMWLSPNHLCLHKHTKSILQVYAVFLLVYAIWLYARSAKTMKYAFG
jgi:hypothetical protein